jgi:hypothetical protein
VKKKMEMAVAHQALPDKAWTRWKPQGRMDDHTTPGGDQLKQNTLVLMTKSEPKKWASRKLVVGLWSKAKG